MDDGRGDAELGDAMLLSCTAGKDLRAEAAMGGWGRGPDTERGDESGGSTRDGDADKGGALNGWKDIDGRLTTPGLPSLARAAARPTGLAFATAKAFREDEPGEDGEEVPNSPLARRADIGLALVVGPTW